MATVRIVEDSKGIKLSLVRRALKMDENTELDRND